MTENAKTIYQAIMESYGVFVPAISGVGASILVSDNKHWKTLLARTGAGLFFSITFTDGFMHWWSLPPDIYRTPVSGLFAMTGFEAVRWLSRLTPDGLVKYIRSAKGMKNGDQ